MRNLSPEIAAHLNERVTSLATCWIIRRRDGVTLGFTTHDRALAVDGVTCQPTGAFTPSAVAASNALNVDDLEVAGALTSSAISAADLRAGRYDHAMVEISLVNWADPGAGRIVLKTGSIGEVTLAEGRFTAEIRGLTQALQQDLGAIYSPECRADLGDNRCGVDIGALAIAGTVASVAHDRVFTATALMRPDDWLAYGRIRWLSGDNAGDVMEIKRQTGDEIELFDAPALRPQAGDMFTATPGCDRRFATCRDRFANSLNFRGEPHVPGSDAVLDYPGLR